jgi:hypothetical protein
MWIMLCLEEEERYLERREETTWEDWAALVTASLPEEYSFWASIMSRQESEGEALLGGTPRMERKVDAMLFEDLV